MFKLISIGLIITSFLIIFGIDSKALPIENYTDPLGNKVFVISSIISSYTLIIAFLINLYFILTKFKTYTKLNILYLFYPILIMLVHSEITMLDFVGIQETLSIINYITMFLLLLFWLFLLKSFLKVK